MQAIQNNRRIILIGLIVLLLVCLVGALVFNVFFRNSGQDDVAQEPTATVQQEEPTAEPDPTATPTPVVEEEPTTAPAPAEDEEVEAEMAEEEVEEADPETDDEETETIEIAGSENEADSTASDGDSGSATGTDTTVNVATTVETVAVTMIDEILKNGSFEAGFSDDGVGVDWETFKSGAATISFSPETTDPFLRDGQSAQRISIDRAYEANQYGGLFQTVEVVPGEIYTLTLHGQIRSGLGSEFSSSYGYRLQYALDESGAEDWRAITDTGWVELPWPEQSLDVSNITFSEYSESFTPQTETVTLFIRGWNKWPDPGLAEYTLDALSIVGPVQSSTEMVETVVVVTGDSDAAGGDVASAATPQADGEMIDKPLPITGAYDDFSLMQDPRFWGAVLVLMLLAGGAMYKAHWRW
jgi:hypothetical protein